ncbi:MAG: C1 family peptidase [Alphaproteobacteria bacterium]|nr:C1 family peptidase [Alphaproteobacteria bacterium]
MKDRLNYFMLACVTSVIISFGSLHAAHAASHDEYPCSTGCILETADDLRRNGVTLCNLSLPKPATQSLGCGCGSGSGRGSTSSTPELTFEKRRDLSKTHPWISHVKSQRQIGSCSAFAVVACLEFLVPGMRISEAELFLRMVTEGRASRSDSGTSISAYQFLIQRGVIPEESFIPYEQFNDAVRARAADESIHKLEKLAPSVNYRESLDYLKRTCRGVPTHLLPEWGEEERYFRGLGKRIVTVPRGFWKETNFYMFTIEVTPDSIINTLKFLLEYVPVAISVETLVKYKKNDDGTKKLDEEGKPIIEKRSWDMLRSTGAASVIDLPGLEKNGFKSDTAGRAGHAICICGYDDEYQPPDKSEPVPAFRFKNSWGTDWGDHGYAWISYRSLDAYFYDEEGRKKKLKYTFSPYIILGRPGERIHEADLNDPVNGLRILYQMLREVKNRR